MLFAIALVLCGLFHNTTTQAAAVVYVSNFNNNTIERFDSLGNDLGAFASAGGLQQPTGLAFDSGGNLYVANQGANTIIKFAPNGSSSLFATSGLNQPYGLAFDVDGNLYAANAGSSTIQKFAPNGTSTLFANTGLVTPIGIAFDGSGNLYAVNLGNSTIQKFAPNGTGTRFNQGLSLASPLGIAFDTAGNLYVTNGSDGKIYKLDSNGVASNYTNPSSGDPYGLAFDTNGNLYVANATGNTIRKYTPPSATGTTFANTGLNGPTFIAVTEGVPEPGTALLAFVGFGLLASRRNRQARAG